MLLVMLKSTNFAEPSDIQIDKFTLFTVIDLFFLPSK